MTLNTDTTIILFGSSLYVASTCGEYLNRDYFILLPADSEALLCLCYDDTNCVWELYAYNCGQLGSHVPFYNQLSKCILHRRFKSPK